MNAKLKPEARALLARVKQHILAKPSRLNMDSWVMRSDKSPCGTAACIAGWVCILNEPDADALLFRGVDEIWARLDQRGGDFGREAQRILGLPSDAPFFVEYWPATRARSMAARAAKIIDMMIDGTFPYRTGGM